MSLHDRVLAEADPQRDADFRALAGGAFDVLDAWVRANFERIPEIGQKVKQFDGWAVPWRVIDPDIDRREGWRTAVGSISPLRVAFAGPGHKSGLGKAPDGGWVIVLSVLRGPSDLTYLDTRMYGSRQTFVHEFIHYLDKGSKRARFNTSMSSAQRLDKDGALAYYLNPSEFNAFYQDGAHNLDTTIAAIIKSSTSGIPSRVPALRADLKARLREILPLTVQKFVSLHSRPPGLVGGSKYWSPSFANALAHSRGDSKWMRKFKHRLAGLHGELERRYGSQIDAIAEGDMSLHDRVVLAEQERLGQKWPDGILLHGSGKRFTKFRKGGHGIYLSDPSYYRSRWPGRLTQAELYAKNSGRGWLAAVRLKRVKQKHFDPFNDAKAEEIQAEVAKTALGIVRDPRFPMHYVDAPALAKAATPFGYNTFEIQEPSVDGTSILVTDPSIIQIVKWYRVDGSGVLTPVD